jgi:hypothetical protein
MRIFVSLSFLFVAFGCGGDGGGDSDGAVDAAVDAAADATTDSGGGGFTGAYIEDSCAPDDGPALELTLYASLTDTCMADNTAQNLTINVFSGTDSVFPITPGTTVTSSAVDGGFGNGSANLCPGGGAPCLNSQNFTITFEEFVQDVSAAGTYSITFEGDRVETGSFDATWCDGDVLCG